MHVTGQEGRASHTSGVTLAPDFEKVITTDIGGNVSRLELVNSICDWICSESLLHEHSSEIAANIDRAVTVGVVSIASPGTMLPLIGTATSPNLTLGVEHQLSYKNVMLALGSLHIAAGAAQIRSNVPAILIQCERNGYYYLLSAQMSPMRSGRSYSECHRLTGSRCEAHTITGSSVAGAVVMPMCRSHRAERLACMSTHQQNVLTLAPNNQHEHSYCDRAVLSRKVAVLSTQIASNDSVHTLFFR